MSHNPKGKLFPGWTIAAPWGACRQWETFAYHDDFPWRKKEADLTKLDEMFFRDGCLEECLVHHGTVPLYRVRDSGGSVTWHTREEYCWRALCVLAKNLELQTNLTVLQAISLPVQAHRITLIHFQDVVFRTESPTLEAACIAAISEFDPLWSRPKNQPVNL